jgi:hypothetical protein
VPVVFGAIFDVSAYLVMRRAENRSDNMHMQYGLFIDFIAVIALTIDRMP